MNRFNSLGVIENINTRSIDEIVDFFEDLNKNFSNPNFTKEDIVKSLKSFLPNFEHEEKGKNLDQKM